MVWVMGLIASGYRRVKPGGGGFFTCIQQLYVQLDIFEQDNILCLLIEITKYVWEGVDESMIPNTTTPILICVFGWISDQESRCSVARRPNDHVQTMKLAKSGSYYFNVNYIFILGFNGCLSTTEHVP